MVGVGVAAINFVGIVRADHVVLLGVVDLEEVSLVVFEEVDLV